MSPVHLIDFISISAFESKGAVRTIDRTIFYNKPAWKRHGIGCFEIDSINTVSHDRGVCIFNSAWAEPEEIFIDLEHFQTPTDPLAKQGRDFLWLEGLGTVCGS
jgi:hypothetical protein